MADAPAPQISISGANTLAATDMTKISATVYTYVHTVGTGNGTATVALSTGTDVAGNVITSAPTSGADFTVDNTAPTAAITYSDADGIVKDGDSLTITATFNEDMADAPALQIEISGANTLAATEMTKTSATVYTYVHTVGAGNGTATVSLSTGTDLSSNVITSAPTSGADFTVDNTAPTVTLSDDHPDLTVRDADTVVITAAFNEGMASTPTVSIDVSTDADADIVDAVMTPVCGDDLVVDHTQGNVAPATATITYGTVLTDLSGSDKCWITQNLGASQQATSATDATDASAGWYWQFNRKQGYAVGPTPAWTITAIDEDSDWTAVEDPCTIELGAGWRLPTNTEWLNADSNGAWGNHDDTYNSVLKLHAAGYLVASNGALNDRGSGGYEWVSTQDNSASGYWLSFYSDSCEGYYGIKALGFSVRCLRDPSTATTWTYSWNVPTDHSGDTAIVTVAGDDITGNAYAGSDDIVYTIDNTAPTFIAATATTNTITLTFSENVTATAISAAWTVADHTVSAASAVTDGTEVILTLSATMTTGETPTINYVAAIGDTVDSSGNEVADGGAITPTDGIAP
ncbi:MAG: hypothetical protein KAI25_02590, partial [Hyphomicrobiaceae bacterium]|nr:hypothetical protein [Hyphomicrobiaceae bacterium]